MNWGGWRGEGTTKEMRHTYTQKLLFLRDEEEMLLGWQQRNDRATLWQKKHGDGGQTRTCSHQHCHFHEEPFGLTWRTGHDGQLLRLTSLPRFFLFFFFFTVLFSAYRVSLNIFVIFSLNILLIVFKHKNLSYMC